MNGGKVGTLSVATDLWLAQRGDGAGLESRAHMRLRALVRHARLASPLMRHLYTDLPDRWVLTDLPPMTKPQMMADFDDWVTNPGINRQGVENHIADPRRAGVAMANGVFVCTSSGTTGHPGLFVHDSRAADVYWTLPLVRGFASWFGPRDWVRFLSRGRREAQVIGVGAHFAGAAWSQRARLSRWGARRSLAVFGANQSVDRLREQVESFHPAVLAGYPSAMDLLAREQSARRMHLDLVLVATSGENLEATVKERLTTTFECPVRDTYGTSETIFMAFGCSQDWLHLSSDWFLLEPVGKDGAPTPPGRFSASALVTNLANRLQPIIRYDIGDSMMRKPEPCLCGSPLPAFRVAGRSGDLLLLRDAGGHEVPVTSMQVGTVVDSTPGTCRAQVRQVGPATLRVRSEIEQGHDPRVVWATLTGRLREMLDGLGLGNVRLEIAANEPLWGTTAGKFRRVMPPSDA